MYLDDFWDFLFVILVVFILFVCWLTLFLNLHADKSEESCIEFYNEINGLILDGCEVYIENYKENLKGSE